MGNRFASGKHAIAECDRCGFRYKLKELRTLVIKTKEVNILVCATCWEEDHPQLQLGMYPVDDPQALQNPRKDLSYRMSGVGNDGVPREGSRTVQWGWRPVGGASGVDAGMTPNYLTSKGVVGNVTIS